MKVRCGIGYDVHRLATGRPLMLGGVHLEGEIGLAGHSDADVLIHALIDALLGASGLGDIGQHFPDHDPRFEGVESRDLLRQTVELLSHAGWRPVNIDSTVIAERPRLGPHLAAMRAALADVSGLAEDSISIKAKTNEGLGALGRGEGIAALAVALVERIP